MCVQDGRLIGLSLTGFKNANEIINCFLTRTGDIQTIALLLCHGVNDPLQNHHVQEYMDFLNQKKLWPPRAELEVEVRRPGNASTAPADQRTFPRCGHCKHPLSVTQVEASMSSMRPSLYRGRPQPIVDASGINEERVFNCPKCSKELPRCAVCLMGMTCIRRQVIKSHHTRFQDPSDVAPCLKLPVDKWMAWCQNCHHVGHCGHLLTWFETHKTCPVRSCTCRCKIE